MVRKSENEPLRCASWGKNLSNHTSKRDLSALDSALRIPNSKAIYIYGLMVGFALHRYHEDECLSRVRETTSEFQK